MANNGIRDVLVSYSEAKKALTGTESAIEAGPTATDDERVERAMALAAFGQALRDLEDEEREHGTGILTTPQNPVAARLQSMLASHRGDATSLLPVAGGGREIKFEEWADWGWVRSGWNKLFTITEHAIQRPAGTQPDSLSNQARIAIMGDWGTGMYGAPVIARTLARDSTLDLVMHLGDVYYSGTNEEVQERFLDLWPRPANARHRALNGNHEMYSGGNSYFDKILPAFQQPSSYFALQNDHWLLIGLDTAHTDHDLDAEQVRWIASIVNNAGNRKLVLFSHHQLFSQFSGQGDNLYTRLDSLLSARRVTAWYWGHEHRCIRYDPHPRYGLRARCVGHGGVPSSRESHTNAPIESSRAGCDWRRLGETSTVPGLLVLDGPNPYVEGRAAEYAPHGYVTLEFSGDRLIEHFHLPDGTEVCDPEVIR